MIAVGSFVTVRGRQWLVDGPGVGWGGGQSSLRLSCVDDDAQGESLEVLWSAEISPQQLDDGWETVGGTGADDPESFSGYLRTLEWSSATAADRDLFQAPFRAGIRLDPYQLLPLHKALKLPRVNLLIADDVGLGKTIEAGLVARELLLRRRVDLIVVAAPPSMTTQWRDELEDKFGLSFTIIDREHFAAVRRSQGFAVNPWDSGSRFIISHRLLAEEAYAGLLKERLGGFRPRALLILDEAHHAAPASGFQYAVASQFTKAVAEIAERFEHRLFLSATPHNGHSNSFSQLLEMLDPQRFTRGVPVRPRDLEPVMVRRLKADLRRLDPNSFPERRIEAVTLSGLPESTPELQLARMLADYALLREKRVGALPARQRAQARLVFSGLQQRLLSSVAAFARTLEAHRRGLERAGAGVASDAAGRLFSAGAAEVDEAPVAGDDDARADLLVAEDAEAAEAASAGAGGGDGLDQELAAVDAMLEIAKANAHRPDERVRWLLDWIRSSLISDGAWNARRLLIFTEYEDTRRWLQKRLQEGLAGLAGGEGRIGVYTGATGPDARETVKRAFNADPSAEPLRILLCTDAAREGVNLQTRCHDLLHFDLPWNPSRLEQRNGRIDRKLQPSKIVTCRYFIYAQRPEDVVLQALVRKTETIRRDLGAIGQVLEGRVGERLASRGIDRARVADLARAVEGEDDPVGLAKAVEEMDGDGDARRSQLLIEERDMRAQLERARTRVGVAPDDLRRVVGVALSRANVDLEASRGAPVGHVDTFRLAQTGRLADDSWAPVFDDLRSRRRGRTERLRDWRRDVPLRALAFEPPIADDGRDADGVVQAHLEHRLVRRLLSRFLSQGFQAGLSRACVVEGEAAVPRVMLLGRLAVYGPGAARLHEEILSVAAPWTEIDRDRKPLQPVADGVAQAVVAELHAALDRARTPASAEARVAPWVKRDVADLAPVLEARAEARLTVVRADLRARGQEEATSLRTLLDSQIGRIETKIRAKPQDDQLLLPGLLEEERKQLAADQAYWPKKLERLRADREAEPRRVRESYEVAAHRLEPVGLVHLWPRTG